MLSNFIYMKRKIDSALKKQNITLKNKKKLP